MSENCVCATIVGHSRFGVLPAVILSIWPDVVGPKVACYEGHMTIFSFNDFSDRDLLAEVSRLAASEREATAQLVASLAEVDARQLYLSEGCSSLFTYCTQVLHLSEHAAYNRIEAARTARRFPQILERLADGSIHLTAVRLLAPTLTAENHRALLDAARHKSKRDIEHLLAQLKPEPDVAPCIRKLPAPAASPLVTEIPPVTECPKEKGAASAVSQAAFAGTVQSSVHDIEGDPRQAAACAGPNAAHDSQR